MIIKRQVQEAYKNFDKSKDGRLQRRDVREFVKKTLGVLHETEKFTEEKFSTIFRALDTNNNGVLSKKELKEMVKKMISTTS